MHGEKHSRPNLNIKRQHKQRTAAGTTATEQQVIVDTTASGYTRKVQWCSPSHTDHMGCSSVSQHLSWPRYHQPTAPKVMRELPTECITTFSNPSSTFCHTLPTMPGFTPIPSTFPSDHDHPSSEVTNGTDLTQWEQMWHSIHYPQHGLLFYS